METPRAQTPGLCSDATAERLQDCSVPVAIRRAVENLIDLEIVVDDRRRELAMAESERDNEAGRLIALLTRVTLGQ